MCFSLRIFISLSCLAPNRFPMTSFHTSTHNNTNCNRAVLGHLRVSCTPSRLFTCLKLQLGLIALQFQRDRFNYYPFKAHRAGLGKKRSARVAIEFQTADMDGRVELYHGEEGDRRFSFEIGDRTTCLVSVYLIAEKKGDL